MPQNTLFNYFMKSNSELKPSIPNTKKNSPRFPKQKSEVGDIVWIKNEEREWIPALLCDCSKSVTENNSASQFTVCVLSPKKERRTVISSDIHPFQGKFETNPGGKFHSTDSSILKSAQEAEDLFKMPPAERIRAIEASTTPVPVNGRQNIGDNFVKSNKENQPVAIGNDRRNASSAKKYRKVVYSENSESDGGSDDDADYQPVPKSTKSRVARIVSSDEDEITSEEHEDEPVTPGNKRKRVSVDSKSSTPDVSKAKSKLLSFQASSDSQSSPVEVSSCYLHETLDFLRPDQLRDSNGNKPDNPDYDSTTLKVPFEFLKKQTPAMHQWWSIKSKNFNVVLFFKVGKFYELYHMDAVVGVKELGLIYMKGNYAHSGFPEVSYGRYSSALLEKGYAVARVEQTETPEQNAQRIRGKTLQKHEKSLRREVCRITTKGTQTYNAWQSGNSRNHESNFLLAVAERPLYGADEQLDGDSRREIGVCFVDTSVGVIRLGQFQDDRSCSRFRTMISHYFPCQVLFERGKLSSEMSKILHTGLASVIQSGLSSGTQFWDASKCLKTLSKEKYFTKNGEDHWPPALEPMRSDTDALGLTAKREYELALSSLGACVFYLKKCLVDFEILVWCSSLYVEGEVSLERQERIEPICRLRLGFCFIEVQFPTIEVLSMGQFELYQCEDERRTGTRTDNLSSFQSLNQHMILDSATLANLEILENSKGSKEGSLLEKVDFCRTPFGRRLLRQWICSPPCHPQAIEARLDAVDDLMTNKDLLGPLVETLSKMPDLERMLAQIHALSKGARAPDHPDSRAVLYEEKVYSKKKINDFMCVLEHYQSVHKCLKSLQNCICDLHSSLLRRILRFRDNSEEGEFPDMESTLLQWKKAFDHKKAKETGKIIPNPGTNPEYDRAIADMNSVLERSESYLKDQKKALCCSQIVYKGCGNKRFQLEVPLDRMAKRISDEYEISGQRKGFKSFRTAFTLQLVKDIEEAEARRDAAQADSLAIVFREFSKDYSMWNTAVQLLAQLDVLISFARFSRGSDGEMCRPVVLPPDDQSRPMLDIRDGRHPCVTRTLYSDSFIPNDTMLGCAPTDSGVNTDSARCQCLLLTGPNMGGKSTLMRQVGLLVVLAQIGCYVPARSCKLTACDRIFTRLGAFDRIMAGESTFFVELGETSTILKHATQHSLVLLDELGRGTSTYDGTAIASAVLRDVAETIQCRTIFSTHYRTLVDDAMRIENVQLGHMACMVEDGESPVEEVLTFLYKLATGACPKSYGFNAALLAGVDDDIVKLAHAKAAELEGVKNDIALFKNIFNGDLQKLRTLTTCIA